MDAPETDDLGAEATHNYIARKQAAHKLITNRVKVLHDITRADGPPPTQQGLVRLPGAEVHVEAVLEEVAATAAVKHSSCMEVRAWITSSSIVWQMGCVLYEVLWLRLDL